MRVRKTYFSLFTSLKFLIFAFDIATLATVADKEDDAKLTVGEPVKAKLV